MTRQAGVAATLAVVTFAAWAPRPARGAVVGTGTAASCTDSALDSALAGGGSVTFNCGGSPFILTVTTTKTIAADTSIDGGGLIALSGGSRAQVFNVNPEATLTLTNLTIATGSALRGGAIYNAGTLIVTNSTFSGNNADGGVGGAIYNLGTLTVTNSTFSANRAGDSGAINNLGTLTVTNSTFSANRALSECGGAITNLRTLTVTNSTFSRNSALYGGAVENYDTLTVSNCTFSGNSGNGGAIHNSGATVLINTIIANSPNGNCIGITDGRHNLDSDGTCPCIHVPCGSLGEGTDPLLDPSGLANHGGPTQTIALMPGSPAISAGDESICAAPPVNNLDQRGYVRPGRGAANCSIGAYEFNAQGSSVPTPTPTPSASTCVGDCAGGGSVTINEIIAVVNIALGSAESFACAAGIPSGPQVNVALVIQAVNNALNGCG